MTKLLLLLVVSLACSGCVASIGNSGRGNATLGQQLIDLQKARESGALTPAEYEVQKARLLGTK